MGACLRRPLTAHKVLRQITIVVAALLLLAGLWVWLQPAPLGENDADEELALNYHLTVADGVVTGPAVLLGRQGYPLRITFSVDLHDRVHLHGYERWLEVRADELTEWVIEADYAGRYLLELENSEIPLASLEIYP